MKTCSITKFFCFTVLFGSLYICSSDEYTDIESRNIETVHLMFEYLNDNGFTKDYIETYYSEDVTHIRNNSEPRNYQDLIEAAQEPKHCYGINLTIDELVAKGSKVSVYFSVLQRFKENQVAQNLVDVVTPTSGVYTFDDNSGQVTFIRDIGIFTSDVVQDTQYAQSYQDDYLLDTYRVDQN